MGKDAFQIFVQPKDKTKELWEGKILGPEAAVEKLGADAAFPSTPSSHFDEAFIAALAEADALYYRVGIDGEFDRRIFQLMSRAQRNREERAGLSGPSSIPTKCSARCG